MEKLFNRKPKIAKDKTSQFTNAYMEVYLPKKLRGSWHFESSKYGYDYQISPYPEIVSDLKILLTILIEDKLLIPKFLEGRSEELNYNSIDDLIEQIQKDVFLQNCFEFGITGVTVIRTEQGEEMHSGIFCIESFRTFQQSFVLSTKSDIWLPMSFDEDNFSFVWNLERHNLNYDRLRSALKKIADATGWENENLLIKEFHERGSLQIGYDLFLSKEVCIAEFQENPNYSFNLPEYIKIVS